MVLAAHHQTITTITIIIIDRCDDMAVIANSLLEEKRRTLNINIVTTYITNNKILEISSNTMMNQEIKNGIRCEKKYYINNNLKHREKTFDTRIEYTFLLPKKKNNTCINCGAYLNLEDSIQCPYCGTNYTITYKDASLGGKYHYDLVLKNKIYQIVTAIIDIIISNVLSFLFIKSTSRTFNRIDIDKIIIYGIILSLALYYFFYAIDGYIILGPIKKYKERQNQKQIDFWNRTKIDKTKFFNNLNYALSNEYSKIKDVIDYDFLDFNSFEEFYQNDILYVKTSIYIRIIYYKKGHFISKTFNKSYILQQNKSSFLNLDSGANAIKCPNCSASVSILEEYCSYCHTRIHSYQEWIIKSEK